MKQYLMKLHLVLTKARRSVCFDVIKVNFFALPSSGKITVFGYEKDGCRRRRETNFF